MEGKWGVDEELFPVYKPPSGNDHSDDSPEQKKKHKKHKKKHKKSSETDRGDELQNPEGKSSKKDGTRGERKRHDANDYLKEVDYSKEQSQHSSIGYAKFSTATADLFHNTAGVLTKGAGKFTQEIHGGFRTDDFIQNGKIFYSATDAVEKGANKFGSFTKDSVAKTVHVFTGKHNINDPYHKPTNLGGSVSLDGSATSRDSKEIYYAATEAVEKRVSKVGNFTKDSVAKTLDVFKCKQNFVYYTNGKSNFEEEEKRASVSPGDNTHPKLTRTVLSTGEVFKGLESTTGAVFKGFEATSGVFSKGIGTTTCAITKSLETLSGRKNEVGDHKSTQKPDGIDHVPTFKEASQSPCTKQGKDAKLDSLGSLPNAKHEFEKIDCVHNAQNVSDENGTDLSHSSLNIEQITLAKKFSHALGRGRDESVNDEQDDELVNGKLPLGLKQIAGTVVAVKGLGRLVYRQNELGVNEASKNADSDVPASEIDGGRVENVSIPKIVPIEANFAVMYWKGGFGIPENGLIQIRDSDLVFTGKIATKLSFKLKDISIEKVSRIGVLRSNGFRIKVVNDLHIVTDKSSSESYLFSVVLKDREEVMDIIQAAIDNFKPSDHQRSEVCETSDDSEAFRDDLATIHTVTTLAKREDRPNLFFTDLLRSIILPFRRLLKPTNFEEAVKSVQTSVNELDNIRLKSYPGGVKSLKIANEIEAIRKCLDRIEKIQNSVPTTIVKQKKRR